MVSSLQMLCSNFHQANHGTFQNQQSVNVVYSRVFLYTLSVISYMYVATLQVVDSDTRMFLAAKSLWTNCLPLR